MSTSIIKVYNSRYGRWESNARVVLEWNGIASLGQSSPVYTNSSGIAEVNHNSSGQATVYINGKEMGRMSTPGQEQFSI